MREGPSRLHGRLQEGLARPARWSRGRRSGPHLGTRSGRRLDFDPRGETARSAEHGERTANCKFGGPDGSTLFMTADMYICADQDLDQGGPVTAAFLTGSRGTLVGSAEGLCCSSPLPAGGRLVGTPSERSGVQTRTTCRHVPLTYPAGTATASSESSTPVPQRGHPLLTTVPHGSCLRRGEGCPLDPRLAVARWV